jgi:hypothetical protein
MRRLSLWTSLFFFGCLCLSAAGAAPTEDSLIQAWEKGQHEDPKLVTLDKTGDRRYHFKTTRFNYDGELRLANVDIEENPGLDGSTWIGVLQVDLPNMPKDQQEKLGYSYERWMGNNQLYYDNKSEQWLDQKEYSAQMMAKSKRQFGLQSKWLDLLSSYGIWLLLMLSVVNLQWRRSKKALKESIDRSERALVLGQESLKNSQQATTLLGEIRDLLKAKG